MKTEGILWGWAHCVQQYDITQAAIDRRLTLITWEGMNSYGKDGEPVTLSTVIADSGTMFSFTIPWNVHGAFAIGALGIGMAVSAKRLLTQVEAIIHCKTASRYQGITNSFCGFAQ